MSEQHPPPTGPPGRAPSDPVPAWSSPPAAPSAPAAAQPPPRRPRRSRGVVALVATTWVLALVLGLGGGLAGAALWDRFGPGTTAAAPVQRAPLGTDQSPAPQPAPGSVAAVADQVLPSVVTVEVETAQGGGSGSGFVVDASGLLLTNNHVVDGAVADGVTVVLSDGTSLPAEVVGRTVRYDLAVLRVDRTGLVPLAFASTALSVGDPVVAVGAPLGLQSTVTTGIVSALDRPVTAGDPSSASYINAVQTDTAINPGNSGGPLVDLNGDVVGINSAIAQAPGGLGGQGGSIGLGFAIPAAQASRTAQEIIDTGRATYPVVGVVLENDYTGPGVQITRSTGGGDPVTPGGPADQAGLRPGDVILAFDGTPVRENAELIVAIGAQRPGDSATLTLAERGGGTREVTLELDASEED